MLGSKLLQCLQHAAGLHRHGVVERRDIQHAVQPRQADDKLVATVVRGGATAHAGVAALRHDGHAMGCAKLDQSRHLLCVGGPANRQRHAGELATPVSGIGGQVICKHMRRAEQGAGLA